MAQGAFAAISGQPAESELPTIFKNSAERFCKGYRPISSPICPFWMFEYL